MPLGWVKRQFDSAWPDPSTHSNASLREPEGSSSLDTTRDDPEVLEGSEPRTAGQASSGSLTTAKISIYKL